MGECSSWYVLLPVDKATTQIGSLFGLESWESLESLETVESVKSTSVQCDHMGENIRSQLFVDIDLH